MQSRIQSLQEGRWRASQIGHCHAAERDPAQSEAAHRDEIASKGTDQAGIEKRQAEAAAEAGVGPARVELWIHRVMISPPPCAEPPWEQRTGPLAADSVLGETEPRRHFERKPDAIVVEPTPPRMPAPEAERPMPLTYPDEGSWK